MPEGLEAEIWRRAAEGLVGRTIERVEHDARCAPDGFDAVLTGASIEEVSRRGKVLVVHTDRADLGVHFGMTGRAVFDGVAAIEKLEYASGADRPDWDRLRLFTDGGDDPAMRMNDPRRLGRLSLDADLDGLGPDLLTLTAAELSGGLGRRSVAIKSALLDQRVVAGLGNLCADEVLHWADIAPHRPADSLTTSEVQAIASACVDRLPTMLRAGGSTHGTLDPQVRAATPPCPRCAGPIERTTIGGRTAVWCRSHQR